MANTTLQALPSDFEPIEQADDSSGIPCPDVIDETTQGAKTITNLFTISGLLSHNATHRPHSTVFSSPTLSLTWSQLASRTARVAEHICAAGISKGDRVAVVLGNSVEAAEVVLAIARAGAVGVLLDPRALEGELAEVLGGDGTKIKMVVTDGKRLGRIKSVVRKEVVLLVVGLKEGLADDERHETTIDNRHHKMLDYNTLTTPIPTVPASGNLSPDEPAWLLYTSGTTSKSSSSRKKAVLSTQRAWIHAASSSCAPALRLTATDTLFWPLPLFHAFGHSMAVVGAAATGYSVYFPGEGLDVHALWDCLQSVKDRVTILGGVPTTFRGLVAAAREDEGMIQPRMCVTGGAPVPLGLKEEVKEVFGAALLNRYGCTELSGGIAADWISDAEYPIEASNNVMRVLPGVDIRIMNPYTLVDAKSSDEGEIWARSQSLMIGYENPNDEEQPFTSDGWYRTGDLGTLSPGSFGDNLFLTITGRLKELIIRGGEKIHPAEIEAALRKCPGVADVVVAGVPHHALGEVPAAFLVPKRDGVKLKVSELLALCRTDMPDYKIPSPFYEIDAIPRTTSGKPMRRAVRPEMEGCRALTAREWLSESDAGHTVEDMVMTEAAAVCCLSQSDDLDVVWDASQQFATWGLSSLNGFVLRDRLSMLTGLELPATLVFEYPTPAAVIEYLRGRLSPPTLSEVPSESPSLLPAASSSPSSPPPTASSPEADPIVIISTACHYPGGITSPSTLWQMISQGIDCTSPFPTDRGWTTPTSGPSRGGFLHAATQFDASLFALSPREALSLDPQQRILLETTWSLFERSNISGGPLGLKGTDTGVYVGVMYSDYAGRFNFSDPLQMPTEGKVDPALMALGSAASVAAGRVSHMFGLHGPNMAVDTACSSSLVAIHLAAQALRDGECGIAVAGGVTVMATPRPFIAFSGQSGGGMLAADGRCRSYSSDANGTGWAEGVGLVLLERLSDARRNGHEVLAVVKGSAVGNNGGLSNGLAAPNVKAQIRVMRNALDRAGLRPADIGVIEGHGTATPLGDPIELRALFETYGRDRGGGEKVLLGSIKSNIGHTQAAAGVAGVIKMVEAMRRGEVPATIHVKEPSRHVDWESGEMELVTKRRGWPDGKGRKRRAAVSSFGIGGTNAHVILEQGEDYEGESATTEETRGERATISYPWLLSGATEEALRAAAGDIVGYIRDNDLEESGAKAWNDVAIALATRRSALAHRAAITVHADSTARKLMTALKALARGVSHPDIVTDRVASGAGKARHVSQILSSGQKALDAVEQHAFNALIAAGLPQEYCNSQTRDVSFMSSGSETDDSGSGISLSDFAGYNSKFIEQPATHPEAKAEALQILGRLHVRGVAIDWEAVFSQDRNMGAQLERHCVVDLPTCTFQRRRYWLDPPSPSSTSLSAFSKQSGELQHPILTHVINIPGTTSLLFRGYLSLAMHPWLADHRMGGNTLVPATVWAEMVLRVGREVGCDVVEELSLLVPLDLQMCAGASEGGLTITVVVFESQRDADEVMRRCVEIYSRPKDRNDGSRAHGQEKETKHATGTLISSSSPPSPSYMDVPLTVTKSSWCSTPPTIDTRPQENISSAYALLASQGIQYGPFFQCVKSVWRDAEDSHTIHARLQLPTVDKENPNSFVLHPALLDAALHAPLVASAREGRSIIGDVIRLPFLLSRVRVFGSFSSMIHVTVRELEKGCSSVVVANHGNGRLVAEIERILTRPWKTEVNEFPVAGDRDHQTVEQPSPYLYQLEWNRLPESIAQAPSYTRNDKIVRINTDISRTNHSSVPFTVHHAANSALTLVQNWIRSLDESDSQARLVIVTTRATVEHKPNLAAAAVWGLVRSAQAERPHRIVLVDVEGSDELDSEDSMTLAFNPGHDLMAIRQGSVMVPRLGRIPLPPLEATQTDSKLNTTGTVLITGGTGALGSLLARHLASSPLYQAKHFLLLSRSGLSAPGARTLRQSLLSHGARTVRILSCDVSSLPSLSTIVTTANPPITAVIHCAGRLSDGLIENQTTERVEKVLKPKVDAAWNLHKLLPDANVSFVLFSSAAGVLGNRGQAGYAAANCFLDALARCRDGAVSLAWGPWGNEEGMAGTVKVLKAWRGGTETGRLGLELGSIEDHQGLDLLDAAVGMGDRTPSVVVPLLIRDGIDGDGTVKLSFRDVQDSKLTPQTRLASPSRLGTLYSHNQDTLAQLVRKEIRAVLGLDLESEVLALDQPLETLGLDSFTGIELRNNLCQVLSLPRDRLPGTLAFEFDGGIEELIGYLLKELQLKELAEHKDESREPCSDKKEHLARLSSKPQGHAQLGSLERVDQESKAGNSTLRLGSLYRQLCYVGHFRAATHLLAMASLTIPSFTLESLSSTSAISSIIPIHRLTTAANPENAALVCFPDFSPSTRGKTVFAHLAAHFSAERDVFELSYPTAPHAVPADLAPTLSGACVAAIRAHPELKGRTIVLVAYSAGGHVAHACAEVLLKSAVKVGLVLLDTYPLHNGATDAQPEWMLGLPAAGMGLLDEAADGDVTTDSRNPAAEDDDTVFATMGAHMRLCAEWQPGPQTVEESLLIHARDPPITCKASLKDGISVAGGGDSQWRSTWALAASTAEVPGSHLQLLDREHAGRTADAVRDWCKKLDGSGEATSSF